jgi:predicted RNase H-like HicB family nuclease
MPKVRDAIRKRKEAIKLHLALLKEYGDQIPESNSTAELEV